jgi:hypothetical protein
MASERQKGRWAIFAALLAIGIAFGVSALPKMKLSGWIILGLFVALSAAIVAFIARCVRLYLESCRRDKRE